MSRVVWILVFLMVGLAWAQEYRIARPGYRFEFPRDHGSHNEFKTEWWYYTGHVDTSDGRTFGYELTFFRSATVPPGRARHPSRWFASQLYLAHFAITDVQAGRFRYHERLNRAGIGTAGAESGVLKVWNGGWVAVADPGPGTRIRLRARSGKDSIDLLLSTDRPPVIHGENGISRKGEGASNASHYYSFTRLDTMGSIQIDGRRYDNVRGLTWMDHEFGSSQICSGQAGWDWFSMQLADGTELMLYRMRRTDGTSDPWSSGTALDAKGRARHLRLADFTTTPTRYWTSPHSKAKYPVAWHVQVPSEGLELQVDPVLDDQELRTGRSTGVTYWEGAVRISGSRRGVPITGRGYVEMTGYAHVLRI